MPQTPYSGLSKSAEPPPHRGSEDRRWALPATFIVDRAVARRHLNPVQKQALNALLREQVLEVKEDPKTGEEKRIGLGQTQRAEMLGVQRSTVKEWDRAAPMVAEIGHDAEEAIVAKNGHDAEPDHGGSNEPPSDAPTHFTTTRGGKEIDLPIHPKPKKEPKKKVQKGLRPGTLAPRPKWMAMFFNWSNRPLPE